MTSLLIGNFGAQNIGHELILASSLETYPDALVMTLDSTYSQNFCETKFANQAPFPTGIRTLLKYTFSKSYRAKFKNLNTKIDQIIFPGGGLFAIRFWAVWIWFQHVLWCRIKLRHIPIHFQHQGVDGHFGFWGRQLIKWSFNQAESISVRDEASKKALKQYGIKKEIRVEDDQVEIALKNSKFQNPNFKKEKIVLVNAKSVLLPKHYEKLNNRFKQYKKYFVNFDPDDELGVRKNYFDRVITPKTKTELLELFSQAEYAIGERLHFLILGNHFCKANQTFTMKKPYSEKVQNFCSKNKVQKIEIKR